MNKSFQNSLIKLDQLIGDPLMINSKLKIHGHRFSIPQSESFTSIPRSYLKRNGTSEKIIPNSSFSRIRKVSEVSPNIPIPPEKIKKIYLAKCKDLNISPASQLEKRFFEFLDKNLRNRSINFIENRLGHLSADQIGNIILTDKHFCRLELSKNFLGDLGIKVLAKKICHNRSLIHVDISSNEIRAEGANFFFKLLKDHESIISIDISSHEGFNKNRIGSFGVAPVREVLKHNQILKFLNLADTGIEIEGLRFIIEGLACNKSLEVLNLANNNLGNKIIKEFLKSLSSTGIVELNLSGNKISNEGAEAIGEFLETQNSKFSPLNSLNVSSNNINSKGSNKLFSGLKLNLKLTALNVESNPLTESAADSISYCLEENSTLTQLNLSGCSLKESGIEVISQSLLKNKTLKTFILKNNQIKDKGAIHISQMLKTNFGIQTLDLSSNYIKSNGAVNIFQSLKFNNSLDALYLKNNPIKEDVAQLILDIIRYKPNLQVIKLEETQIGVRFLIQISSQLEKNKTAFKGEHAKRLKTRISLLAKRDFNTNEIFNQIFEKKKEEIEIIKRLEVNKKTVDDLRVALNIKIKEIEQEHQDLISSSLKLSQTLQSLEHTIAIEDSKYQNEVNKLNHDIAGLDANIRILEYRSK
jgi:Ran GTPase-activating protein (RanGAP) involved in mRNA processing and transport